MALDLIQRGGLSQSSGYDPAYGGIPTVPSVTGSASNAIGGNIGNLASLYSLSSGAGAASGRGVINALNEEIPGVSGSIGAANANIGSLLSGQVPQDVINQLKQQSAELGVGRGMGAGAPATNAEYLRSLGLTSLGMMSQGQQELDALMTSVPRAPAFDPSSMLVTPAQEQQWDYMRSVLANAPNPAAAAAANLAALRAGTGVGGFGSSGGASSRPPIGGPAFDTPPLVSPSYANPPTAYSTGTDLIGSNPNSGYANWQNLASTWGNGMSQEDIYNLGLTPAIEDYGNIQDMPTGMIDPYAYSGNEEEYYQ